MSQQLIEASNLIIPARAGSKEIAQKNLKLLGGIPLIAHTIKAAKAAQYVREVYVSTDGAEIAQVAKDYGAKVIERPAEIACDKSSSEAAILHALEYIKEKKLLSNYTCFAQCTSPFTAKEDFDQAINQIQKEKLDSLFAASQFKYFIWQKGQNGKVSGINHQYIKQRVLRQDKPPEYIETGAFYIFKTNEFIENKNRFFGKIGIYEMPKERFFEIDSIEDLEKAQKLIEGCHV
jgi:CMP-N,N'-diacetyllegionaminic acid synthase